MGHNLYTVKGFQYYYFEMKHGTFLSAEFFSKLAPIYFCYRALYKVANQRFIKASYLKRFLLQIEMNHSGHPYSPLLQHDV